MRITLREIHKYYGNVSANDGIHMEIAGGTIHGILGENGAGKSTLMKILAGYVRKSSGTILFNGQPAAYGTPSRAVELGVGMLYQDPLDFPPLTVLENFAIGLSHGLRLKESIYEKRLLEMAGQFGFNLHPRTPVRTLTVGERQQLELLRLLALKVEVLILDEPTTGISGLQKQTLFTALKALAKQGKTILLVSHKLEDVESLCDRVTVLRRGKVKGETARPFETGQLLKWMFGSDLPASPYVEESKKPGNGTFAMEGISAPGGRTGLNNCNVMIEQGEIVGLAGLEGSGQGLFLRLAAGLKKPEKGRIRIGQKDMTGKDHHAFRAEGVTFLPAGRLEEGLMPGLTIMEHFALQPEKGIRIPWKKARMKAEGGIKRFKIAGSVFSKAESLSGGNQQRLLLALLPRNPFLLIMEHPTRGLDLDSIRWVWEKLSTYVVNDTTILFSSAELDEIFQVAGRILVFFNGIVVKDLRTCDTKPDEIVRAIAGKV